MTRLDHRGVAPSTGFEPATVRSTGGSSNQLSYESRSVTARDFAASVEEQRWRERWYPHALVSAFAHG